MNVKNVPIACFVSPLLRHQIKILAAQQGTTVRQLILAELQRVVDRAQTQPGNSNEIDKSLPAAR